jgi:hypothetical protein
MLLLLFFFIVLYTYLTRNEMGDIPFFCPEDYSYSSQLIRTACQVRAANLLIMWLAPGTVLALIILSVVNSYCTYTTCCFSFV